MNIAMVLAILDTAQGAKYYAQVVEHLAERGNRITVLTKAYDHSIFSKSSNEHALSEARTKIVIDGLIIQNVRVLYISGLGIRALPQWIRSLCEVTRFIRKENPPIIHTHGISDTLLAYTAKKLSMHSHRLRIITSFHGVFSHAPLRYMVAAQILNHCSDVIMPVSKSGAEKLKRYGLSNKKNLQVVPNGVDLIRFDPTIYKPHPQLAALREKGIQLVGIVGRLSPEKGHTVFLEAAAKIAPVIPNVKFVIVGDGQMRPELELMATRLGLKEQVLFMGMLDADEIPSILTSLDVVALTSFVEAFPLTVLETMAMQKPMVATSVGDIPDIIQQDITGILVSSRDASAVSEGIIRLLRDPRLRETMGIKARQRIEQHYSINEIVSQIEAQYCRLIEMENKIILQDVAE